MGDRRCRPPQPAAKWAGVRPADKFAPQCVQGGFGGMVPLCGERPFLLPMEGIAIKGRIDAIYGLPNGRWEVVDWKTGRVPPEDDPLGRAELLQHDKQSKPDSVVEGDPVGWIGQR